MSYTALYRKFRPAVFSEVKGQDAIVTTLRNQIESGRIGHAYLFCGTRGTGKTTVAKILAKAVNCEHPVNGDPCGECAMCRAIADGSSMNVIEIDAASNNGVDNIREIREEVAYAPTEGKYKVYIIDEVHMLSAGAFNALLKTLEEPPSYVIFILATTEIRKIPQTILSRCQRYDFRRIAGTTVEDRLRELLDREGIEAEKEALSYLARQADGSMRDALSLTEQCIGYFPGEKMTYEKILDILGAVDDSVYGTLLFRITNRDAGGCISLLGELLDKGRELSQLVSDFIWYLRNLLLLKSSDSLQEASEVLELSVEKLSQMQEDAGEIGIDQIFRLIRIFSDLSNELRMTGQKRILVEVALLRVCRPEMESDVSSLAERIRVLEEKLETGAAGAAQPKIIERVIEKVVEVPAKGTETAPKPKPIRPEAIPDDVKELITNFRAVMASAAPLMQNFLEQARLSLSPAGNLLIVCANSTALEYMKLNQKELEEFLSEKTGKHLHVELADVPEHRRFEDCFTDVEEKIHMPIETVEEDE